jgi:hypothetical protein
MPPGARKSLYQIQPCTQAGGFGQEKASTEVVNPGMLLKYQCPDSAPQTD